MTLEQLLKVARDTMSMKPTPPGLEFERTLVDMLGEDLPCGFETPGVRNAGDHLNPIPLVNVSPVDGVEFWVTTFEARAYAAAILHACDRAETK